jgi:hypothetical protein
MVFSVSLRIKTGDDTSREGKRRGTSMTVLESPMVRTEDDPFLLPLLDVFMISLISLASGCCLWVATR